MIYLDNAATTPLTPSVITAMSDAMAQFGNPSSIHQYGREASHTLRICRQTIADALQVNSRQIIFTSGGTESNNTAIKGYAIANQSKGKHLITTSLEHHSVLHTMAYLEERFNFEVTYIHPINGHILPQQIADALRPDTILVSTMFANNETGYQLPIAEIGELLKNHQAVYHVDAVQAIGKLPIYPKSLGIDFLSASAHKFHGPKGVGFLYATQPVDNLLHGGEQEEKRRASTENTIGIAGLAQAIKDSLSNWEKHTKHIESLRALLLEELATLPYYVNGNDFGIPQVLNIGFPNQDNAILLTKLDLAGIAVSTGSACTAGTVEPSHVLSSLYGKDSPRLKESIRISFSELTTRDDVIILANTLKQIIGDTHGI